LNLQAGKLIALIGANGIGKSTLNNNWIQKPLSGTIALNGKIFIK
jgi:iron complex transport system ATP-binding protein